MAYETYDQRQEQIIAATDKAPFITAPTGGLMVDAELRAAINAVRQLLIDRKIMKTS